MEIKDERLKKSLRYSILDGTFCSAMVGFGESFFSAFAVFLKATNLQLGLLSSLPQTIGSLMEFCSDRLLRIFKTRKKLVCTSVMLQSLMYIFVALVFFLGDLRVFHMIFFVCLYWVFGMIGVPAWSSWMGDLVDSKWRGDYFGKRNRITGLTSFVAFLMAGYLLQAFADGTMMQYYGFAILFGIAMVSRMLSFVFLLKQHEPEYKVIEDKNASFIGFVEHARFNNYGLFVIYLCLTNFAVYVSAPFFAPYMLQDLNFNYKAFTIITASAIIVKFLTMPIWGKLADKYGTKKVLAVTGFMMPLVPLLWVFSKEMWFLVLIQFYSGFVWAGFEIASFNFILDTTVPEKRTTYIAYYNMLNGISLFAGAMIGSLSVRYNVFFWSDYYIVFILSAILRALVYLTFMVKIKEVRKVEDISGSNLVLKVLTTMTTGGIMHHLITFKKKDHEVLDVRQEDATNTAK